MTFSECYRKAKANEHYVFDIIRYNPNGSINETFEYYHHIVTIDGEEQLADSPMEQVNVPLRWLTYDDWELKISQ